MNEKLDDLFNLINETKKHISVNIDVIIKQFEMMKDIAVNKEKNVEFIQLDGIKIDELLLSIHGLTAETNAFGTSLLDKYTKYFEVGII